MKKIFAKVWWFFKRILIPIMIVLGVISSVEESLNVSEESLSEGFDWLALLYTIFFVAVWNLWRSESNSLNQTKKAFMQSVKDDERNGIMDQAMAEAAADSHVSVQKSVYVLTLLLSAPTYIAVASGASVIISLIVFVIAVIFIGGLWSMIA